jgi:hypothetical protein
MESTFHRYEDWPSDNSTLRLPRLTSEEARVLVADCDLTEERPVTGGPPGYVIREFRHRQSGEYRYVGGVFAGW